MYFDGELPIETFKERMQLVAKQYGTNIDLYGYNRDDLGELPPLNTVPGQAWLRRELDEIKPDLVIFDSIMCLLIGSLKDEEMWAPVKTFMRELSSRKIAQIWFHHANESGVSYGDKTREWEMDVVVKLSHPVGPDGVSDDEVILWEWKKTRLKTPQNWQQFQPMAIRLVDDKWEWDEVSGKPGKVTKQSQEEIVRAEYVKAYKSLAGDAKEVPTTSNEGLHTMVRKVAADAIKNELVSRGFLELKDTGGKNPGMTDADRKLLSRVKKALLAEREEDGGFCRKGRVGMVRKHTVLMRPSFCQLAVTLAVTRVTSDVTGPAVVPTVTCDSPRSGWHDVTSHRHRFPECDTLKACLVRFPRCHSQCHSLMRTASLHVATVNICFRALAVIRYNRPGRATCMRHRRNQHATSTS